MIRAMPPAYGLSQRKPGNESMKHLDMISKAVPAPAVYDDNNLPAKVQQYMDIREIKIESSPFLQIKYP